MKTKSKYFHCTSHGSWPISLWGALHVPTPFCAVQRAARSAALWLLLWRCQPGQNKGRAETKQPQTRASGRALTAKSGLAADARVFSLTWSLTWSLIRTLKLFIPKQILTKRNKQTHMTNQGWKEENSLVWKVKGFCKGVCTSLIGAELWDGQWHSLWSWQEKNSLVYLYLALMKRGVRKSNIGGQAENLKQTIWTTISLRNPLHLKFSGGIESSSSLLMLCDNLNTKAKRHLWKNKSLSALNAWMGYEEHLYRRCWVSSCLKDTEAPPVFHHNEMTTEQKHKTYDSF